MNKQILLTAIYCLFLGFNTNAQCPVGIDATIITSVDVGGGQCRFRIEVSFATGGADNTSIKFTIGIDGGATLYTTDCYENLIQQTSYTTAISDPSLIAPCNANLVVSYTAYIDNSCIGPDCAKDVDIPVNGSLPIDLVSFTGYEEKFDRVKLEWVTASEEQNDYFSIQRSADGKTFQDIGVIDGSGNSTTTEYYSFMDEQSLRGDNYYRLKQINMDNSYEFSKTILVENKIDQSSVLTLAPTVADNEIAIIFNELPKVNSLIEVFDQNGINIINTTLAEGEYTLDLDLSAYAPGMYFIRVPIGREFVVKKFIKVAK